MTNKWITHVKQYSKQHGISYPEAMIKAKASYTPSKRLKGGQTLKDFGDDVWYDKIPEQYHPGLESLGRAGLSQMGFGLKKKRKPRKKGGDLFSDIGNVFKPVADVFRPVLGAYKPVADYHTKNIKAVANNPIVKRIAKVVAKEVLKYGVASAGPAAAAAATAAGHPELAIPAAALAVALANEAKPFGDSYIDGLGLRKRRIKRGKALVPAGHY
jgi:hypothetical protein